MGGAVSAEDRAAHALAAELRRPRSDAALRESMVEFCRAVAPTPPRGLSVPRRLVADLQAQLHRDALRDECETLVALLRAWQRLLRLEAVYARVARLSLKPFIDALTSRHAAVALEALETTRLLIVAHDGDAEAAAPAWLRLERAVKARFAETRGYEVLRSLLQTRRGAGAGGAGSGAEPSGDERDMLVHVLALLESALLSRAATTAWPAAVALRALLQPATPQLMELCRSDDGAVRCGALRLLQAVLLHSRRGELEALQSEALSSGLTLWLLLQALNVGDLGAAALARLKRLGLTWLGGECVAASRAALALLCDGHRAACALLARVVPEPLVRALKPASAPALLSFDVLQQSSKLSRGEREAAAKCAWALQASGELPRRDYGALFEALDRAHASPELLWSRRTKAELAEALARELRDLATARRVRAAAEWDAEAFSVEYRSLAGQLFVGGYYVRLLLPLLEEGGAGFALPPAALVPLVHAVFNRMVIEDRDSWKLACLRLTAALYERFAGALKDLEMVPYLVWLMAPRRTRPAWRDCILRILARVLPFPPNAHRFVKHGGVAALTHLVREALRAAAPPGGDAAAAAETRSGEREEKEQEQERQEEEEEEEEEDAKAPAPSPRPASREDQRASLSLDAGVGVEAAAAAAAVSSEEKRPSLVDPLDIADDPLEHWPPPLDAEAAALRALALLRALMARAPRLKRAVGAQPDAARTLVWALAHPSRAVVSEAAAALGELLEGNLQCVPSLHETGFFLFALYAMRDAAVVEVARLLRAFHRKQLPPAAAAAAAAAAVAAAAAAAASEADEVAPLASEGGEAAAALPEPPSALAIFLPSPLLRVLDVDGAEAFAAAFDGETRSPAVVWGGECRGLLMRAVADAIAPALRALASDPHAFRFSPPAAMAAAAVVAPAAAAAAGEPLVRYAPLEGLLCVDDVYVELFVEAEAWPLREPARFFERLVAAAAAATDADTARLLVRAQLAVLRRHPALPPGTDYAGFGSLLVLARAAEVEVAAAAAAGDEGALRAASSMPSSQSEEKQWEEHEEEEKERRRSDSGAATAAAAAAPACPPRPPRPQELDSAWLLSADAMQLVYALLTLPRAANRRRCAEAGGAEAMAGSFCALRVARPEAEEALAAHLACLRVLLVGHAAAQERLARWPGADALLRALAQCLSPSAVAAQPALAVAASELGSALLERADVAQRLLRLQWAPLLVWAFSQAEDAAVPRRRLSAFALVAQAKQYEEARRRDDVGGAAAEALAALAALPHCPPSVRDVLQTLLTPALARCLGDAAQLAAQRRAEADGPALVWTAAMREELAGFLARHLRDTADGEWSADRCRFGFRALEDEAWVGDLYLRRFVAAPPPPPPLPRSASVLLAVFVAHAYTQLPPASDAGVARQREQTLFWCAAAAAKLLREHAEAVAELSPERAERLRLFWLLLAHAEPRLQQGGALVMRALAARAETARLVLPALPLLHALVYARQRGDAAAEAAAAAATASTPLSPNQQQQQQQQQSPVAARPLSLDGAPSEPPTPPPRPPQLRGDALLALQQAGSQLSLLSLAAGGSPQSVASARAAAATPPPPHPPPPPPVSRAGGDEAKLPDAGGSDGEAAAAPRLNGRASSPSQSAGEAEADDALQLPPPPQHPAPPPPLHQQQQQQQPGPAGEDAALPELTLLLKTLGDVAQWCGGHGASEGPARLPGEAGAGGGGEDGVERGDAAASGDGGEAELSEGSALRSGLVLTLACVLADRESFAPAARVAAAAALGHLLDAVPNALVALQWIFAPHLTDALLAADRRPQTLVEAFDADCDAPDAYWNEACRREAVAFLRAEAAPLRAFALRFAAAARELTAATLASLPAALTDFRPTAPLPRVRDAFVWEWESLRKRYARPVFGAQLCVAGVFVRRFNENPRFKVEATGFLAALMEGVAHEFAFYQRVRDAQQPRRIKHAVANLVALWEAATHVVRADPSLARQLLERGRLPLLLGFLAADVSRELQAAVLRLAVHILPSDTFSEEILTRRHTRVLAPLLHLCHDDRTLVCSALRLLDGLCQRRHGVVKQLRQLGAMPLTLCVALDDTASDEARATAALLLQTMTSDEVFGEDAAASLAQLSTNRVARVARRRGEPAELLATLDEDHVSGARVWDADSRRRLLFLFQSAAASIAARQPQWDGTADLYPDSNALAVWGDAEQPPLAEAEAEEDGAAAASAAAPWRQRSRPRAPVPEEFAPWAVDL